MLHLHGMQTAGCLLQAHAAQHMHAALLLLGSVLLVTFAGMYVHAIQFKIAQAHHATLGD
jgi:hypothetical protein